MLFRSYSEASYAISLILIPSSPDGHQFESCKEASAYLLSVFGVQDRSHLKSSYSDGAQQLSSSMNRASESVS